MNFVFYRVVPQELQEFLTRNEGYPKKCIECQLGMGKDPTKSLWISFNGRAGIGGIM